MDCPNCGKEGEHRVTRTAPEIFSWGDSHRAFFERVAGKDLSYRERTKLCERCDVEFETVEMSKHYLYALVAECDRLSGQVARLRKRKRAGDGDAVARRIGRIYQTRAGSPVRLYAEDESGFRGEWWNHSERKWIPCTWDREGYFVGKSSPRSADIVWKTLPPSKLRRLVLK